MKALAICSMLGIACSAALHVLALTGRTLGDDAPLMVLFPMIFVCFGSAVIRAVVRGIEEQKPRLELPTLNPRWLQWLLVGLIGYGFAVLSFAGNVSHSSGEAFTATKAVSFYGAMISFFAMALLFHLALSAKKEPNKAPEPTTMAVTPRAPSSTSRASHGRGSS